MAVLIISTCPIGLLSAAYADYPTQPITVISGFPPGAAAGFSASCFAEYAPKYLASPQPILVNYKPGAAAAIAADYVLKQPPDGYTLFLFPCDLCVKLAIDAEKLSFKLDDFIFIGANAAAPNILVVNREKSPFKTFKEFVDYARKHPEGLSYGSSGFHGLVHLVVEVLMSQCGIKIRQIPFAGGAQIMTALLGGHVDCGITTFGTAGDHVKPGGGLRALTVFAKERWPECPDVPTALEEGYPVEHGFWCGLSARKETPQPVLDILSKAYKNATDEPESKERLKKLGFSPVNWGAEEMAKKAKEEFELARRIFKK